MKKIFLTSMLLIMVIIIPVPTMAGVNVGINIGLPLPPIVFSGPPYVVALPYAFGVYAVPDVEAEIYFWNGWWWRPWQSRWYRSRYYDRGWTYYSRVPSFYFDVDPGWRGYYRDHRWDRGRWEYERIPYKQLHENWRTWHNRTYWHRQDRWNVERYNPLTERERKHLRDERRQHHEKRRDHRQHRR